MKKVTVKWIDSEVELYQTDRLPKPLIIETTGWLVKETDDYLVIARDLIGDEYRGLIAIPKINVQ